MSADPIKGYYSCSERYPSQLKQDQLDDIAVGRYYVEGGCDYEFQISIENMGGDTTFRVIIWNDATVAFTEDAELLAMLNELVDGPDVHKNVLAVLDVCGYTNMSSINPIERAQRVCRMCGHTL